MTGNGDFIFEIGMLTFLLMVVIAVGGIVLSIVKRTTKYLAFILCGFLTTQLVSCQAMVYGIDYDDVASPNYEMLQNMTLGSYIWGNVPYLVFIGVVTALCYYGINKKSRTARKILLGVILLAAVALSFCIVWG